MISRISVAFALAVSAVLGVHLVPDRNPDRDRVGRGAARDGGVVSALQSSFAPELDVAAAHDVGHRPRPTAAKRSTAAAAIKAANRSPSAHAPGDRIMFASKRGGTMDLYSMNDDGTDIRLVVGGPRDEMHPDISPDGTRIAFVRADDVARPLSEGNCCGPAVDLLTADIDGSGITPLMPDPVIDDYRPDWSPDGTRIAFSRGNVAVAVSNIFTVEPDGSALEQVTDGILGNNVASWSPDGTQLVFVSTRAGSISLWITDADGENQHPLTAAPPGVAHTSPQWSPMGDRIVFGSTQDGGASELYTIRPDGSELTRLTTNAVSDSYATWSPDGRQIAVSRGAMGGSGGTIWVMNADGSDQRQISEGPLDTFPVYFPRAATQRTHGTKTR